MTTREKATVLGSFHSIIEYRQSTAGKVLKLGILMPYALTHKDLDQRSDSCAFLLFRRRHFDWFDDFITGNEKCTRTTPASVSE